MQRCHWAVRLYSRSSRSRQAVFAHSGHDPPADDTDAGHRSVAKIAEHIAAVILSVLICLRNHLTRLGIKQRLVCHSDPRDDFVLCAFLDCLLHGNIRLAGFPVSHLCLRFFTRCVRPLVARYQRRPLPSGTGSPRRCISCQHDETRWPYRNGAVRCRL